MNMEEKLVGSHDNITNVNQEITSIKVDTKSKASKRISKEQFNSVKDMLARNDVTKLANVQLSRAYWKKLGRAVKTEEIGKCRTKKQVLSGEWIDLYSYDQTRPKRKYRRHSPRSIDFISALFVVNQSAKRYGDMASNCHYHGFRGFASHASDKMKKLLALKDKGVVHCVRNGLLNYVGIDGNFALYRSADGQYYVHSGLWPESADMSEVGEDDLAKASAKNSKKRYLLKDAVFSLKHLPDGHEGFNRIALEDYIYFDFIGICGRNYVDGNE